MKIFRLKINSSVVVVNLGVLLAAVGAYVVGWLTDNTEMLKTILSPNQVMLLAGIQSLITILLRTTNVQGKKPIEILPKDDTTTTDDTTTQ